MKKLSIKNNIFDYNTKNILQAMSDSMLLDEKELFNAIDNTSYFSFQVFSNFDFIMLSVVDEHYKVHQLNIFKTDEDNLQENLYKYKMFAVKLEEKNLKNTTTYSILTNLIDSASSNSYACVIERVIYFTEHISALLNSEEFMNLSRDFY